MIVQFPLPLDQKTQRELLRMNHENPTHLSKWSAEGSTMGFRMELTAAYSTPNVESISEYRHKLTGYYLGR